MKIILRTLITAVLATLATVSYAVPPVWDFQFGPDTGLVGDEESISVNLGFDFPFAGNTYNSININTNGGVALGNNGMYDPINQGEVFFSIWPDVTFEDFFTDAGEPLILVFATDLDNTTNGTIHFKTDADTAVVTWLGMATFQTSNAPFISFQLTLESDGTITFGYAGITGDLIADMDEGIVVGVSNGDGAVPPGGTDLSAAGTGITGGNTPTAYEIWCLVGSAPADCQEPGQTQDAFDLEDMNIIFQPNCTGGLALNNIGDFIFNCFGGGGGGGGCSLAGTGGRSDPLSWLLLALISAVPIVLRRRKYKNP